MRLFLLALYSILSAIPVGAQIVPSCEPLYGLAPTIAEIVVDRGQVFDDDDPLPSWLPAATVNHLHPLSRPGLIEQELLFAVGEPLDRQRLEETLRNLRALGVLRHEQIFCEPLRSNRVRVKVSTRDAWSLEPILDLAVVDAGTSWTVGLRESNLLGLGKRLRATFANRFGDSQLGLSYADPRILGSRWQWSVGLLDFDSGESASLAWRHPFFSLETPWAGGVTTTHRRSNESFIVDGEAVNGYQATRQAVRAEVAHALVKGAPVVHRAGLFFQHSDREFQATDSTVAPLPSERTEDSVGLLYRRQRVDFITERRVDHFDRPEFFNMGNDLSGEIGFSTTTFGADRDELIFRLTDVQGLALRQGHFLRLSLSASGRLHDRRFDNLNLGGGLRWVVRETPLDGAGVHHTLVGSGDILITDRLDDDRFLSLGESTGLRGYSNHTITGDHRLRLTFEDRIFVDRTIADLLSLGGIAFVDAGYVWEKEESIDLGDMVTGVGIGLRLAWTAAANEQVIRLDLAWPLDDLPGDDGDPKVSFVTTTRF